jgi:PAS domain S-box-containing protein
MKLKKMGNSIINQDTTEIILESISDGVFTIDNDWKITSFNNAAEKITGIQRKEAIGKYCWDIFRSNMCERDCALKKTMDKGKSFMNTSGYIINSKKKRVPITTSTSLLINKKGKIIGGVEVFRDHSLVEELRKELSNQFQIENMASQSPSMKKIFKILPQIAKSDSSVLLEGETGTGKEIMAKAIHNLSDRKDKPFIAINCGALPDTLLESELFGHMAGAFTGATKDKPGHFALAEGGTIFLDEIGETSAAFQVRMLRVIQEREIQPLGATKIIKTDIRIIAATNKDLADLVAVDKFRQDLFYRINVVGLRLPPLRNRMEDLPLLVDLFIQKLNRIKGKSVQGIDPEVLQIFMTHNFPGNIRELENIIEYAFVLCSTGIISHEHLPSKLWLSQDQMIENNDPEFLVKNAQAKTIMNALKENKYKRQAAADTLGIHKSTLFRRMKKLGLNPPKNSTD